jgi:NAD(P)-dependent dehydrogenase (short-subunit alcohol dehydrogenase family)
LNIQDRSAIVTGGASGLGKACVEMLIASGGRVMILDVNEETGRTVKEELGDRALFVKTDVTSGDSVAAAVESCRERFGGLQIVINCAGIGPPAKVLGKGGPLDLERFKQVIDINLVGTFNVIRLAAAAMVQNEPDSGGERGVILNTASVAAFEGQIGQAAYSASKGGVVSMSLPIARELARYGIRVNTIAPGIFDTPMLAALPEKARESLGQQVPFPARLGRPPEFAALARHIIENTMLNGETIRLDGAIRMAPR